MAYPSTEVTGSMPEDRWHQEFERRNRHRAPTAVAVFDRPGYAVSDPDVSRVRAWSFGYGDTLVLVERLRQVEDAAVTSLAMRVLSILRSVSSIDTLFWYEHTPGSVDTGERYVAIRFSRGVGTLDIRARERVSRSLIELRAEVNI
jgi:hypothetical protein